jgi:hypothetical protein
MLNIQGLKSITEKSIIAISKLKNLECLNITQCDLIKCDYLIHLKHCKLKILFANGLKITDIDMKFLNYLNDIYHIAIEGVNITDDALDTIKSCVNLTNLSIRKNMKLTENSNILVI